LRSGDVLLIIRVPPVPLWPVWNVRSLSDVTPDPSSGRPRVRWIDPLDVDAAPVPQSLTIAMSGVFAMRQRAALFGHDAPEWRAMPVNVMSAYAGYKVPDDPSAWLVFEWP